MSKIWLKNLEKGPKNPKRDLENLEILVEKSEYTLLENHNAFALLRRLMGLKDFLVAKVTLMLDI